MTGRDSSYTYQTNHRARESRGPTDATRESVTRASATRVTSISRVESASFEDVLARFHRSLARREEDTAAAGRLALDRTTARMTLDDAAKDAEDAETRAMRENVMCFVRNLPYDCDDETLETTFSERFGPVKESWVVREKGSTTHRGFGYVKFAIPEDAREACGMSGKIEIGKRRVAVVMAKRKAPVERSSETARRDGEEAPRREKKRDEEERLRKRREEGARKSASRAKKSVGGGALAHGAAERTVVIGGLKLGGEIEGVDADAVKALAREAGELESITEPCPEDVMKVAKIREDGCKRGALLAVYKDEATARKAVEALHGEAPKSKSRRRRKGKSTNDHAADDENDEPEEKVWARMLAGEGSKPKQWRVIVRNLSFKATKAAIREALSAAGFVWDINVPTDFHNKPKGFAFITYTCKADADRAVSDCNGVSISGRQVAVDIALSKSKYQEEQNAPAKTETGDERKDDNGSDGNDGSDDDEDDESGSSSSDDENDESEDEEAREKSLMSRMLGKVMADAEPAPKTNRKPVDAKKTNEDAKPKGDARGEPAWQGRKGVDAESNEVQENACVFVRNLPLEATWQQLKEKMMKYGKVKSCRVVKDKVTGKHTGNAFVDFTNPDSANSAVEASKSESAGIFVAGRPVTVALALSKAEAADMMARQGSKYRNANKHRDNRNIYLAQEGDIHEASAAADGVSKSDIEKRRRSNEERQIKLKNPNYFVSRTRLSVRNIPPEIDSKTLKRMFIDAVKQRATQAEPKVLHAKLLYDKDRMDENGKPKSKGMGFVEFTEHEHALTALRALNNNPEAFSRARRPIVEFSIEDARAVRKLELKAKHRDERHKKQSKDEGKPRGAEQAAKRVAAKEKKEKQKGAQKSDGPAQKRARGEDGADNSAKPPKRDADQGKPSKKPKKQRPNADDSNAASRIRQRAAEAQMRDRKQERREVERSESQKKQKRVGADKRDRTDDLIDAYFAKDSIKSWM